MTSIITITTLRCTYSRVLTVDLSGPVRLQIYIHTGKSPVTEKTD